MRPGTVLVCFDGSGPAVRGLGAALETMPSSELVVLAVWQSPATWLAEGGSIGAVEDYTAVEQAEKKTADESASAGTQRALAAGRQATARVEEASESVWETILGVADDIQAAVIVIGSRGRGALKGAVLGSVSREVLAHSTWPLLIVPPHDD
ncbi:universal stress protein [Streptomyces sp. NPDC055025]